MDKIAVTGIGVVSPSGIGEKTALGKCEVRAFFHKRNYPF